MGAPKQHTHQIVAALRRLGVDSASSPEEVTRAWKRAMLAAHPDKTGGTHEAALRLNSAYAILRSSWQHGQWPPIARQGLFARQAQPSRREFDEWRSELSSQPPAPQPPRPPAHPPRAPPAPPSSTSPPWQGCGRRTWRVVVHPEPPCTYFVSALVNGNVTAWTSIRGMYEAFAISAQERGATDGVARSPALFRRRLQALGCFRFTRVSAQRRVALAGAEEGAEALRRRGGYDADARLSEEALRVMQAHAGEWGR